MLKLLKYEMIHEWRSYGIIYMIFLAVCILCPILFRDQFFATRSAMDSNTMADFLGMIAIMAIMIMSMAIVVSTAINLALNYRNSMFKRPGYLTLTLPVSTHQLILSKVLADILWIVAASFVLFLGYTLMVLVAGILVSMELPSLSDLIRLFSNVRIDLSDLITVILSVILVFSGMAEFILYLYMVITLPQTRFTPRHKTAISVTLFFAISIVMGMIQDSLSQPMDQLLQGLSLNGVISVEILFTLLICALFYGVIYFILEKKLEVE